LNKYLAKPFRKIVDLMYPGIEEVSDDAREEGPTITGNARRTTEEVAEIIDLDPMFIDREIEAGQGVLFRLINWLILPRLKTWLADVDFMLL